MVRQHPCSARPLRRHALASTTPQQRARLVHSYTYTSAQSCALILILILSAYERAIRSTSSCGRDGMRKRARDDMRGRAHTSTSHRRARPLHRLMYLPSHHALIYLTSLLRCAGRCLYSLYRYFNTSAIIFKQYAHFPPGRAPWRRRSLSAPAALIHLHQRAPLRS